MRKETVLRVTKSFNVVLASDGATGELARGKETAPLLVASQLT